jgi:rhodanese-related sulfurtransferase
MPLQRGARCDAIGGVKGYVLPGGIAVLLLGSCEDGVPPASPPEPVAVQKPAVKPAADRPKPQGKLSEIRLETLFPKQQAGTVLLYDARPSFVSSFGKIPGAIPWPRSEYDARLAEREKQIRDATNGGKTVVIYCTDAACPDARAVAEKLAARGHDIAILAGGFALWKDTGLPTE